VPLRGFTERTSARAGFHVVDEDGVALGGDTLGRKFTPTLVAQVGVLQRALHLRPTDLRRRIRLRACAWYLIDSYSIPKMVSQNGRNGEGENPPLGGSQKRSS
jgi:hypothetical protein